MNPYAMSPEPADLPRTSVRDGFGAGSSPETVVRELSEPNITIRVVAPKARAVRERRYIVVWSAAATLVLSPNLVEGI